MKKRFFKLFAFAFVCMLVASMAIPASAVQIDENGRMFGIKVGRIKEMQTTINSSGKKFVDYELPSNATVYVTGTLKHSIESGENIRAGACYWNGSKYVAGPVADTEHDVPLSGAQMAVADLVDGKTYYGYVKNVCNSGGYVYSANSNVESVHLWCYGACPYEATTNVLLHLSVQMCLDPY